MNLRRRIQCLLISMPAQSLERHYGYLSGFRGLLRIALDCWIAGFVSGVHVVVEAEAVLDHPARHQPIKSTVTFLQAFKRQEGYSNSPHPQGLLACCFKKQTVRLCLQPRIAMVRTMWGHPRQEPQLLRTTKAQFSMIVSK